MNTSIMPHGRTSSIARSTRLKPGGTRPRRIGSSRYSSAAISMSGNSTVEQNTITPTIAMSWCHNESIAPISVVCTRLPFTSISRIGNTCAIVNVISAASASAQIRSICAALLR
ncbi:hypothetical protein BLA6993_07994 [Burkholderia lata]|nr:hypothetical protein BLA6993_07994 [Burkholderia lata]